MVDGVSTPSTSTGGSIESMGDKELLEFYQRRFEELQRKEDKYKEKVDKHLQELIDDRHELDAEVLRRGEKISDLQRAVIDLQLNCFDERARYLDVSAENEKLKKNEERLHRNIRELLNITKDKDLRDRIIYVLQDPKVEIGYRHSDRKPGIASSSNELFKEQIEALQSKLDEYSKISKNKSDIILEDCKLALEKSKEKLIENEEAFRKLQKKLQDTETELCETKKTYSELKETLHMGNGKNVNSLNEHHFLKTRSEPKISKSCDNLLTNTKVKKSYSDNYNPLNLCSRNDYQVFKSSNELYSFASDVHLSLILLSKRLTQVLSLLYNIQSSDIYIQAANLPVTTPKGTKYASESSIIEFQNCIRQCTRLSYEVNNIWKSLNKALSPNLEKDQSQENMLNTDPDIREFATIVEEIAISTAEVDLLTINLSRATFFDYLTGPKQPFEKYGVKEANNHRKYISDVNKMEAHLKRARVFTSKAVNLAEKIKQKCSNQTNLERDSSVVKNKIFPDSTEEKESFEKFPKGPEPGNKESESISKNNFYSGEKSVTHDTCPDFYQDKSRNESNKRKMHSGTLHTDDVTRRINKTLAKINHIESGEYFRDDEFCKHLGEQVNALMEKLKDLYDEFNVKSLHEQFSEYSAVTLKKLETLAKQSSDAVLAAEAQISAHRSNAKLLSQKLRDAEDMLRESINECLSLKQKLQVAEIKNETEKLRLRDQLQERLNKVQDFDELETAVKEVSSAIHPTKDSKRPATPYECLYCKQGSDHKLCDDKIKEIRSKNRKLATELKLLQQELKEEKKLVKMSQEQANKATLQSASQSESLKGALESLELKNASLMEQLKLEKNRVKNMERFRRLEIEGFQTDIRNLKAKIQEMEKQLMKAVLIFEHDKKDLELLETIHTTAQRSKTAIGAIKRLKAKLYELETDIKHL